MNRSGLSETDIDKLLDSIKWAAADYEWPRVQELTTQLLEQENLPSRTTVAMLRQRARAYEYMGHVDECVADLETAISLAESADLPRHYVKCVNQLVFIYSQFTRELERGLQAAETALIVAEQLQAGDLEAECHWSISWTHYQLKNQAQLQEHAQRALLLAQQNGKREVEAGCYCCLALYAFRNEEGEQNAVYLVQQSLSLYLQLGQHAAAAWVHHSAAFERGDIAARRDHYEQTLFLGRETHHVLWQLYGINGVANGLLGLGLYQRAEQMLLKAVQTVPSQDISILWFLLSTLAECYLYLGQYERVAPVLEEMQNADKDARSVETALRLVSSGQAALGLGQNDEAIAQLRLARDIFEEQDRPYYQVLSLAWLGAAELAKGDIVSARQHTAAAIKQSTVQIQPQEVWWWHYQTSLQGASGQSRTANGNDLAQSWQSDLFAILDRACELMLDYFGHIGDEGLRRNYLNKVPINREITLEWSRKAAARGESLAPFTERETKSTSFEEQFQRLVEIGNRLTAQRDPQTLPEMIRNEFVELSGAERAIVALRDEEGELFWASTLGIEENEQNKAALFITPYLNKVRDIRAPALLENEGAVAEGDVPELHLRSVIALPLVSQGRLWGVLYGDMRHIFGRFTEQDLSLLNLLANQAAVALENADWVRGLEQKVEERTAELREANKQAKEARQIAEQANEAKSSFLASMSHELRTPLNAIIGFTRIVKRKLRRTAPEKQLNNLDKVLASAEHLLGLINTVLDLAKIEAGRMDVLPSEYEAEALVEMCLATAQPLARPGVQMVGSVPPDLPTAYSDQDKIRQILLNTLSNAAKFTHEGSIKLQVQQQDGLLLYEVIDSGIGMNEDQLARVFEEFQQAESTTARDYGGTGLGLPISKKLAQLLGGDLVATSMEGAGSTFTLSIPIRLN